jgi:hypothetical protein
VPRSMENLHPRWGQYRSVSSWTVSGCMALRWRLRSFLNRKPWSHPPTAHLNGRSCFLWCLLPESCQYYQCTVRMGRVYFRRYRLGKTSEHISHWKALAVWEGATELGADASETEPRSASLLRSDCCKEWAKLSSSSTNRVVVGQISPCTPPSCPAGTVVLGDGPQS